MDSITLIVIGIVFVLVAVIIIGFSSFFRSMKNESNRFETVKQTSKEHRFEYLDTYYFHKPFPAREIGSTTPGDIYTFYYLVKDLDDNQLYLVSDFEGLQVSAPSFSAKRSDVKIADFHSQGSFWIDKESVCDMKFDGKKLQLSFKRHDGFKYDYELKIAKKYSKIISQEYTLYHRNEENDNNLSIFENVKFVYGFVKFDKILNENPKVFLTYRED